jgi:hypothetical protein
MTHDSADDDDDGNSRLFDIDRSAASAHFSGGHRAKSQVTTRQVLYSAASLVPINAPLMKQIGAVGRAGNNMPTATTIVESPSRDLITRTCKLMPKLYFRLQTAQRNLTPSDAAAAAADGSRSHRSMLA